MISSNTRASRSRFSSPSSQSLEAKSSAANDGSKTFMQRWLEPSVQSKASFEEAGLMRYGVLETMAPLGTLPKPKKTGGEAGPGHQPVRRIILRPSGSSHAANHQDNHQAAAHKARPRASSPPARLSTPPPPPASAPSHRRGQAAKDAEDEEYDPKGAAARRRPSRRVSLPAKQAARQNQNAIASGEGKNVTTVVISPPKPKPVVITTTTTTTTTPKRVHHRREPDDAEFADKVVEAAVDEALMHYRYPTAWALRSLYDERSGDSEFVAMIEDVFKQRADADTMDEFARLIEVKKREGKKDDQGCYYFVPPSTNSRFTPHKPKAAPYARLLLHHADADDEGEVRAAKRSKTSHANNDDTPRSKPQHGDSVRTPSRRRNRRDSGSSESSLSSAMSLSSPEASVRSLSPSLQHTAAKAAKSNKSAHHQPAGGGRGSGGGGGATVADTVIAAASTTGDRSQSSHDAPKSRPITSARRKSLASDKQPVSNCSPEPTSPTHPSRTHASATDASMPGRVSGSDLLLGKSTGSSNGSKSACLKDGGGGGGPGTAAKAQMPADDDDLFWTRRRDAQKATNAYTARESSVRNGDDEEEREVTPARRTRRPRQSLVASVSTRATRSASKRPSSNNVGDDVDIAASSPLAFSFNEGSSTVGSRAVTPTALRPTKKPRTGLRIKLSPMKKKGGTAAGVPRSTGETPSATISNGAPRDQGSDNDEYCSACGNTGDVVCCDGCPRSFHFECVDMVQSDHLPDEWFCNECNFRRHPSRMLVYKGVFASALIALERSNPRAFSLPKKTQTRFEGVKAGADGDYEEVTTNRTKKRAGYDELPDFFKQREDGEAVICHACQKPATEIRAIIPCCACPFHWHIDCLDPPLAMPPVLKTWRCPAHVDDVLGDVPPLAPAHRFRKLKGGQVISPALSRGNNNNGHIELDWGDEPEEPEKSGWRDPDSFGKTYRLQAKGVVLDFIEQLRHRGAGYGPRHDETRWVPYAGLPRSDPGGVLAGSAYDRKVNEMQASLNLLGLKQSRSENIDQLTAALLLAADDNVLALMAKASADNIASGHLVQEDKMGLRAMLAQMNAMGDRIRHLLGDEAPLPTNDRGSPVTDTSDVDTFPEKTEPLAPVTEPTPPSTVDHGEVTMELD